ncbi:MAG: putative sporulation protein YtxC [Clostridiales bacterium]|nr:putative sporulation protein YtxC [Clostridiales bacterium]
MHLFSIGIDEKNLKLKDLVYKKSFLSWVDGLNIEEKKTGNLVFLNFYTDNSLDNIVTEDLKDRVRLIIADALSSIILDDLQSDMVEKIIREEYFYFEKKDQDKILRDALAIMWGGKNPIVNSETIREQWRDRVLYKMIEHMDDSDELIFDGFIRFRLKDFAKELENSVDRAVDDLLIENEYNEFIKLLQYFVEIQDPKVDEVHIFQQDNKKYTLLDSNFRVIQNDMLEQLAYEISDKEISHDDLLISSLITIAPCKITIHEYDKIKNVELLNTINNVFTGKVTMSQEGITPKK